MNKQSIEKSIDKLREIGVELINKHDLVELANIINDKCNNIEMDLYYEQESLTLEQLESIVMSCNPGDIFYLKGGLLHKNNQEGSYEQPIGDVMHISLADLASLLNK